MLAILIGASCDTPCSGEIPLTSGQYEFIVEGLVDSSFIVEHTGWKVEDKNKFTLLSNTDLRLIRVKEGKERFSINVSVRRI